MNIEGKAPVTGGVGRQRLLLQSRYGYYLLLRGCYMYLLLLRGRYLLLLLLPRRCCC